MDFFDIFSSVITAPRQFFNKVRKETTIKNSLIYWLIFIIIINIVGILPSIIDPLSFVAALFGSILSIAFSLAAMFVSVAVIQLFIMLLGGKKGFVQTFKAVTYGGTPSYLFAILFIVLAIFIPDTATPSPGLLAAILIVLLVGIATFVYTIVLQTLGASILHSITKFRAFAAVFLLPAILWFLIFLALLFLLISLGLFVGGMAYFTGTL